jgi:hypothetical protein
MIERKLVPGRRRFLQTTLPLGTIACLGCKGLMASRGLGGRPFISGQDNKFSENPGMTTEETYRFFYGTFVPILQFLAKDLGREKMIADMTKASAERIAQFMAATTKNFPVKGMKAFASLMTVIMNTKPYNKAITYEVVESSDKVYAAKYTQCLPAKIWKELKATDFGYALECSFGDAMGKAFDPRMKYVSVKNIFKGDDYCLERFELE